MLGQQEVCSAIPGCRALFCVSQSVLSHLICLCLTDALRSILVCFIQQSDSSSTALSMIKLEFII